MIISFFYHLFFFINFRRFGDASDTCFNLKINEENKLPPLYIFTKTEEKKKIEQIDKKEKKKKKPIRTEKGEIGEEGVEGNLNLKNGRQFSEITFYDDIMNVNNSDFNFNSFCTANNFFSHREDLNDEIINSGCRKEDDRVHSSHSSNKVYLTNSNRNYHRDDNKNDNNNGNKYSKNDSQNIRGNFNNKNSSSNNNNNNNDDDSNNNNNINNTNNSNNTNNNSNDDNKIKSSLTWWFDKYTKRL